MMLRVYCLQQWYGLSDPGMEEALYDMESMRRFAGIELNDEAVPDETSILNFRRLLETHELTAKIFAEVVEYLEEHKLLLRQGTIVDATIIAAPPSTRNAEHKRDRRCARPGRAKAGTMAGRRTFVSMPSAGWCTRW